jgi:hybrid cluster-associated redox disulfide protein
MEHKINHLEMTVAEILDRWPAVISIFLEYRLSCVGCSMSEFETLSDAVEIYHLPREQFLGEVEKAIRSSSVDQILEV